LGSLASALRHIAFGFAERAALRQADCKKVQDVGPLAVAGQGGPEQRFGTVEPPGSQILQAGLQIGIGLGLRRGRRSGREGMARCVDPPHGQGYTNAVVKDVDLFTAAMGDVKPLAGRKRAAAKAVIPRPKAEGPLKPQKKSGAAPGVTLAPELTLDDHNFDRDNTARALGRGKLVPQASLDLHGMTLASANAPSPIFLMQLWRRISASS